MRHARLDHVGVRERTRAEVLGIPTSPSSRLAGVHPCRSDCVPCCFARKGCIASPVHRIRWQGAMQSEPGRAAGRVALRCVKTTSEAYARSSHAEIRAWARQTTSVLNRSAAGLTSDRAGSSSNRDRARHGAPRPRWLALKRAGRSSRSCARSVLGPSVARQSIMRVLALVAVASLALATPGCPFIGAGIGAAIPATKNDLDDPVQRQHASRGTRALLGAGIGLVVDILVVSWPQAGLEMRGTLCPTVMIIGSAATDHCRHCEMGSASTRSTLIARVAAEAARVL